MDVFKLEYTNIQKRTSAIEYLSRFCGEEIVNLPAIIRIGRIPGFEARNLLINAKVELGDKKALITIQLQGLKTL
ncbi:hypothetical protein [Gynuella sp.]|uniref:hypothetical protein n=1 Tax=Gynuella sp. TaxID=2969146 RepID=UPI003D0BC68C